MTILLDVELLHLLSELKIVYSIQGLECRGRKVCVKFCGVGSTVVYMIYVWSLYVI